MTATLVERNTAGTGANVDAEAGLLYYLLPTPPGYWLPNSDCTANRVACPAGPSGDACRAANCSTTSGAAASGWTPTHCQPPLVVQLCDWQTQRQPMIFQAGDTPPGPYGAPLESVTGAAAVG